MLKLKIGELNRVW